MRRPRSLLLSVALLGAPAALHAQRDGLVIGPRNQGIAFGNVPRVTGVRVNFRDDGLERVDGVNITVWMPHHEPSGLVNGVALGIPVTGAGEIRGIAIGVAGVGASDDITGLGVGGIGIGTGGRLNGIMVGGIGAGSGGGVRGLTVGGIGVGSGGEIEGIAIGGIGVGSGADTRGALIGGIGVGSGGDVEGVAIGGVGVGAGGGIRGLTFGGLGVGTGGGAEGITIAGIGIGSGGELRGLSIAGLGIGSSEISGLAIAAAIGGEDLRGVFIAPAYLRIPRSGEIHGVSASALNHVEGTQYGLSIGVINHARRLRGRGFQLGALNYVRSNPRGMRLLPVINWNASGR